ncbi:MAG: hypothetical protein ACRD2B_12330 [Terriglobia bacterium]
MDRFKIARRLLTVALVIVLAKAALAVDPAQAAQARSSPRPPEVISGLWVSETTHNIYRVRIKGGTLYAEKVNIPPNELQHGAYIRTECRREGNRWIGTTNSYLRCEMGAQKPYVHWCHVVTRTEISAISQNRITGQAEALKRFDCHQCKVLEKEWKSFTWVRQE